MSPVTRREYMRRLGTAALAAAWARPAPADARDRGSQVAPARAFCLFSKHLPELGWSDVGRATKEAGFDGVDLTVRPGGHVAPERAAADLPRAIDAIRAQGVTVPMITTDLTSANALHARPLLEAAARSGVAFFKTGYWRYSALPDVRRQVEAAGAALEGLAALARDCGIELGFHNHAAYIGAAIWDIAPAMDRLDRRWAGYYFDPRHAVAEGGGGAWKAATRLAAERLKMVAVKDCLWVKDEKGWHIDNCPLGQGLVDWAFVGEVLRQAAFSGPISLHLEYKIPPGTKHTLEAAIRDLAFARRFL
jgi:sugar phosphate isomerase/epimerase